MSEHVAGFLWTTTVAYIIVCFLNQTKILKYSW